MSAKVIPFPKAARFDEGTKGTAVVVAPRNGAVAAWVRTERGWVNLVENHDWERVLAAGRAYAARFGLPFRFQSVALDPENYNTLPMRGGEVVIEPSERDSGSWDIAHVSSANDAAEIVGNAFAFDEAVAEARRIARERGATFGDDATGGTAA